MTEYEQEEIFEMNILRKCQKILEWNERERYLSQPMEIETFFKCKRHKYFMVFL
jgi:hypothetical protein